MNTACQQIMLFMPMLKRRIKFLDFKYVILWILTVLAVIWIMNSSYYSYYASMEAKCNSNNNINHVLPLEQNQVDSQQQVHRRGGSVGWPKAEYIRLKDDVAEPGSIVEPSEEKKLSYNRNMPLIFVGGVPRSGTTLMRAMLDAHPKIRCGEETRVIPRIIYMRNQWAMSKKENERLKNAGMSDDVLDSAVASFILEVIVKHGRPAENLCNKDPLVLRYSNYMKSVFPNSKYILMIRDGRATVHSIITRKVTITGFDLTSYRDCLARWNNIIESMYAQCISVGPETCMPVYYEQLVLHPEAITKSIFEFLNITWHENVIHHEEFIGEKISLSKVERSSDQVVKPVNLEALTSWVGKIPQDVLDEMDQIAPMLRTLGYDPNANPPNYGDPDPKIKENTFHIQQNRKYWGELGEKFSIHAPPVF